jgi:GDP-L-fucose synthase
MKILITGGNGYVGSALKNALSTHDVYAPTSVFVNFTRSEDVDSYFKTHKHFDIVIHCAVRGGSRLRIDDWSVMDDNLKMYYNLLSNRDCFDKFINIGSGAELFDFLKPYGMSKRVISESIYNKDNFYNIRVFGVFDENELDTRFIKSNIKRYINRQPMEIHENKLMDFMYMEDLVSIIKHYITSNNPPKETNCCYETVFTLAQISSIINLLGDYKVDVNVEKQIDCTSYKPYIGTPTHPLAINYIGLVEGITKTYKKLVNETNIILN